MFLDPDRSAGEMPKPDRRRVARRLEDQRLLRREREVKAAYRITSALSEHLALDELAVKALQTALEVVNAESGSILLADQASRQLIFQHSIGTSPVPFRTAIAWDQGIAGSVFQSGKPVVIADVRKDARHLDSVDKLTGYHTRDLIALPLKRWEGEPIGVLEVLNKRDGCLDEDDLAILTIVSAIAATSVEQALLHREAKLAEVARIVGDIGHDIKNLLMPVVCGTELLESEVKGLLADSSSISTNRARASFDLCTEVIGMVRNSTRRIQDHVKEIADCVKGLSAPPEFSAGGLSTVVESVFETLRRVATEKGIKLQAQGLESLPPIMRDERRLFNAFYNLVNNAIEEVPSGGSIMVSGRNDPARNGICLRVADTGRGMSPEVRDSLFTVHAKSRKVGGTGLGTKIVKDVVDIHGGTIGVESTVGVGTTFELLLPLNPADPARNP